MEQFASYICTKPLWLSAYFSHSTSLSGSSQKQREYPTFLHYSPNIVDLTVQLIELKRELFYFSPSNYIAQFVEVRDAELAKQSDNLFRGVSSECIDNQIELDLESLFVDIKYVSRGSS